MGLPADQAYVDRQKGYGSAYSPSSTPGAGKLAATQTATGGSTVATGESKALVAYRNTIRKKRKKAQGWAFGGTGSLFKRAEAFDESQHPRDEDGKFAPSSGGSAPSSVGKPASSAGMDSSEGKKGWSGERLGLAPKLRTATWASQYRPEPGGEVAPSPGKFFASISRKPQIPAGMAKEEYVALGQWAADATREVRDHIVARSERRRLIPKGTDPKVVRAAFNHARNLAMHDVGLFNYDFSMSDEAKASLKGLEPFMLGARRALGEVLRAGKPGAWAPFRAEFGEAFKDGRVHAQDTKSQKAGEVKRAFPRHQLLVKRAPGGLLAKRSNTDPEWDFSAGTRPTKAGPGRFLTEREIRARAARAIEEAQLRAVRPTPGQAEAGNYRKGHLVLHGLPISIEQAQGSVRRGTDAGGKEWSCVLPAAYGYVKGTLGADGDHVDVYLGPLAHDPSMPVFVVDQRYLREGTFDEHKCVLGVRTEDEARQLYTDGFSDGKGAQRIMGITRMTLPEFRAWLKDGDQSEPVSRETARQDG